ncbi:hypothetical protein L6252_03875 [Candidatus Parcubacteria bacterium]|nr:hypothetical protein [Candidatus Parcubacteria bacterium]
MAMNKEMMALINKVLGMGFLNFLEEREISGEEMKTLHNFIEQSQGIKRGMLIENGLTQAGIVNGLSLLANKQTRGMFPLFPCHHLRIESNGSDQKCLLLDMSCTCLLADSTTMSCFWKRRDAKVRKAVNPKYITHPNGLKEIILA